VPVLINKALIEIPPLFVGKSPVNPNSRAKTDYHRSWNGVKGLAEDVLYYGEWIRDEAEKRIGHLYPKIKHPGQTGEANALAWFWARTVKCPNPACGAVTPLTRSFVVASKRSQQIWTEPVIDRRTKPPSISFAIKTANDGNPPQGTVTRNGSTCICCQTPILLEYVRSEAKSGHLSIQMMAIVVEGHKRKRLYSAPTNEHEYSALNAHPIWQPETDLPEQALGFRVQGYGMTQHADLFTARQLTALTTISDLIQEVKKNVYHDALAAGFSDNEISLKDKGNGARSYSEAVAVYLSCAISRLADYNDTICSWNIKGGSVRNTFARQAIPMTWDFIEINPLVNMSGNWLGAVEWVSDVVSDIVAAKPSFSKQQDVANLQNGGKPLISTDPPYYDNVPYADLSDFFYVWLRPSLKSIYPDLFGTLLTPKAAELIADPFRRGSRDKAKKFFEEGLSKAFFRINEVASSDYPITIFYAFKQAEKQRKRGEDGIASTGWETMLEGLIKANLVILRTWPMRTERKARIRGIGSNALASSIVLVCRPRNQQQIPATRKDFLKALSKELSKALQLLQQGNVAPVDLAQASIGPGMVIFTRYSKVMEADGSPMTVRTALQLINKALDEYLAEQEGEYDPDTRFAITWFQQFGMEPDDYGIAETLATARNVSVRGVEEAGILEAKAGTVRLLPRTELPPDWNPLKDNRLCAWEATQHLIQRYQATGGETAPAQLLNQLNHADSSIGQIARDLAYRLYAICDRKKWTEEALAYNSLVTAWPDIVARANEIRQQEPVQTTLDL
ncbi:MAG: hypothetical protein WA902_04610, partial [Thermosynechococcaceae cyanobacterium]